MCKEGEKKILLFVHHNVRCDSKTWRYYLHSFTVRKTEISVNGLVCNNECL